MEKEELATKVDNLYQMALNRRLYWIHAEEKCETDEERFEVRKAKYAEQSGFKKNPYCFKQTNWVNPKFKS